MKGKGLLGKVLFVVVGILLLGFLAIQLVPVQRSNPPITREIRWDSQQTRELARRACMDCHSNETIWPWYAYVAPVSWMVAEDVEEGRAALNFSEWDRQGGEAAEGPGEVVEVILEGYMPPAKYLPTHPEARLTAAEKQQLADGLRATIAADPAMGAENGEEDD